VIRHVAMFDWKDDAPDSAIKEFATRLATMPDHIDVIKQYNHGDDLGLGPATSDYVLVADFDNVEDYRRYATDPYHVAFIESYVKPIAASVSRVQYHMTTGGA